MRSVSRLIGSVLVAVSLGVTAVACTPTAERRAVGEFVDDSTLTTRVKTALVKTQDVPARNIDVDTFRGEVSLSGFLTDPRQIQRAVEVAQSVQGVRVVHNKLTLAPAR
jgi:osmotically-inducible protein OsmY